MWLYECVGGWMVRHSKLTGWRNYARAYVTESVGGWNRLQ